MSDTFEASMNFDLENVRPFLQQLEDSLSLGLDVDRLTHLTKATALDTLNGSSFDVQFGGMSMNMKFSAYMDDFDAPDLYFYVPSEALADAIDAEMDTFCKKMGI